MPPNDSPGHRPPPRAPVAKKRPPTAAPPPITDPYDTSTDPTLQRILALGIQRRGDAEGEALRQRKQMAIDYGDTDLARELGLDDATIAAAGSNPFSRIAKMKEHEANDPRNLDQGLNDQNLFYSSTAGQKQSELAKALLEDRSNASRDVRGGLGGISSDLLTSLRGIEGDEIQGRQDASDRLQNRLGDLPFGAGTARGAPVSAAAGGPLGRAAMPGRPPPRPRPRATGLAPHSRY